MDPRRVAALAYVLLFGCGDAPPAASTVAAVAAPPSASGDLLLARARLSIEDGVLAPELAERILASTAPEHAHARRLLHAIEDGVTPTVAPDDDPLAAPLLPSSTTIAAPTTPDVALAPDPAPAVRDAPTTPAAAPPPSPAPTLATLERVSMQRSKGGATLSIQASAGVLVGVASQPEAGIVRLVLDDVRAVPKVLSSRPGVTGARVRSIDAGSGGVRITLALAPGWRFAKVRRTATGAKVELVAPS